jgi:hypothetical protein
VYQLTDIREQLIPICRWYCKIITWLQSWDNLNARGTVANDRSFLPRVLILLGPIRTMNELALEILQTGYLRPFPVAMYVKK